MVGLISRVLRAEGEDPPRADTEALQACHASIVITGDDAGFDHPAEERPVLGRSRTAGDQLMIGIVAMVSVSQEKMVGERIGKPVPDDTAR
ncbi:hypothetical protein [Polymorphobacter megasporae]|uniref:hypothetical protein n=1 Tax=Glacieibacterium megasporae TaxID=2835787 RepID=UPI001C1DF090|nr:hypothetical protein [Polymorphobacter megasporae]UAJ11018.1 hypothetical protein KTC28_04710 [Polymorphobacter megasporae]